MVRKKIIAENDLIDTLEGGYTEKRNLSKKFLIDNYGNKCMKCGWETVNEFTNKIPIQLEHKDGNSDNWKLENLELLCPNCHSLTKTYGGANRGNGRYVRRMRYKKGISS